VYSVCQNHNTNRGCGEKTVTTCKLLHITSGNNNNVDETDGTMI